MNHKNQYYKYHFVDQNISIRIIIGRQETYMDKLICNKIYVSTTLLIAYVHFPF